MTQSWAKGREPVSEKPQLLEGCVDVRLHLRYGKAMASVEPTPTASTRELKQNPAAVIARVLANGQIAITAHGRPTGVRVVPDVSARRWISGAQLNRATPTALPEASRRAWHAALDLVSDALADPWTGTK